MVIQKKITHIVKAKEDQVLPLKRHVNVIYRTQYQCANHHIHGIVLCWQSFSNLNGIVHQMSYTNIGKHS